MTLPLFEQHVDQLNIQAPTNSAEEKFNNAITSIRTNVLDAGFTPVLNSSYGKDSVVTKMAVIKALKAFNAETGKNQKLIVATALCGGMESPVIAQYVGVQIEKLKEYAKANYIDIEVIGVEPNFDENYLLQMIGGKTIQTFAKGKAQCSIDVKQSPVRRMVNDLTDASYVTILGTRFAESTSRGNDMAKRNEAYDRVTTDAQGRMTIPPIATMTDEEVFEIVRKASWQQMGVSLYDEYECPVDAGAVVELYGKGSEHSCSTKAFLEGVDGEFDIGETCSDMSGRYGCWLCGRCGPQDKKHLAISKTEGYSWLKGFLDVREALMATEFNYDVRTWLNKKVDKEGNMKISLGSYSPEFCKKLLKWTLTLRADSGYKTIQDNELIWLMFQWVRYGFPDAFEIVNIRNEILLGGKRYYPTKEDMTHHAVKPVPEAITVNVADEAFGDDEHTYWGDTAKACEFISPEDAEAFFEYHWDENKGAVDFRILNEMAPTRQLQIITAWAGAGDWEGGKDFYDLTPARARGSKPMLQRANLLHRLDLRRSLGDRERLMEVLGSGQDFSLEAY